MKRLRIVGLATAIAVILSAVSYVATAQGPLTERVITEADNGGTVSVNAGELLVVRVNTNPSTGYSRAVVTFPDAPIALLSHKILAPAPSADGAPVVGAPRISEFRFVVNGTSKFGRQSYLKILNLRPFAKGVDPAGLFEVKVVVPATNGN